MWSWEEQRGLGGRDHLGKVTEMNTLKGQKEMFEERHQVGI